MSVEAEKKSDEQQFCGIILDSASVKTQGQHGNHSAIDDLFTATEIIASTTWNDNPVDKECKSTKISGSNFEKILISRENEGQNVVIDQWNSLPSQN